MCVCVCVLTEGKSGETKVERATPSRGTTGTGLHSCAFLRLSPDSDYRRLKQKKEVTREEEGCMQGADFTPLCPS